jgi:hypothetical protein
MIVVVDDQQHPRHCKKKYTFYVTLAPPRWTKNQAVMIIVYCIRWVHYGVDEEDRRGGGD